MKGFKVSVINALLFYAIACSSVLAGRRQGGEGRKHGNRKSPKEEQTSVETAEEKHTERKEEKT